MLGKKQEKAGVFLLQNQNQGFYGRFHPGSLVCFFRWFSYRFAVIINCYPKSKTVFLENIWVDNSWFHNKASKKWVLFYMDERIHATCTDNTILSHTNICRGVRSFTIRSFPTMTAGSKFENCHIAYVYFLSAFSVPVKIIKEVWWVDCEENILIDGKKMPTKSNQCIDAYYAVVTT